MLPRRDDISTLTRLPRPRLPQALGGTDTSNAHGYARPSADGRKGHEMQEQDRQPEHERVGGDEVPTGLPAQRGCLFFRGMGIVPLSRSEVSYIFRHLVWRGVSQNCVLSDPSTAYGIRTIAVFTHRPCPRITSLVRIKAVLYNLFQQPHPTNTRVHSRYSLFGL